jgi:hypothetical protein
MKKAVWLMLVGLGGMGISHAQSSRIRLQARLTPTADFRNVQSAARFEKEVKNGAARLKFNVQVTRAGGLAGATLTAVVTRPDGAIVHVASFTVNQFGRGVVDQDTTEGDIVPDMSAGDVVSILAPNGALVSSGALAPG